jgi:hypothetical protein
MKITIPISIGELLDKITILKIKSSHSNDPFIHKELNDLIEIAKENKVYDQYFIDRLYRINLNLWAIEDQLRKLEKEKNYSDTFITLARSVYLRNDERARIKKEVNEKLNSEYQEVKIY